MDFERYQRIENALVILRCYRTRVTPERYRELKRQAIAVDTDGAIRELKNTLREAAAHE